MQQFKIIAEVKTKSPFGYVSDKSWDELFRLAEKVGNIISVHTDPRWGGSLGLIKKAKSLTDKPILAKGIHETDERVRAAFKAGADLSLVVGRIPELPPELLQKCLIEPLSLDELRLLAAQAEVMAYPLKAVWNSRDLRTGGLKKESFAEARKIFSGWLCQASNVKTIEDIYEGTQTERAADAVLVGTHLEEFAVSLDA